MTRYAAGTYETIRSLRAVAAGLVVVQHALEAWTSRNGQPISGWTNGSAGVDIFFVISGFVMVYATHGQPVGPGGAWRFLQRRLLRIVPPYWICTALKIGSVVAAPVLVLKTHLGLGIIIASFLFLPYEHLNRPVLAVGWTLTHEMSFYLLFAAVLCLRLPLIRTLVPVFVAVALVGLIRNPETWPTWTALLNSITVEFLFGVLIAKAAIRNWLLPAPVAALTALAGGAYLMLSPDPSGSLRFIEWGAPAAALVYGLVALEPLLARRIPAMLGQLGDASYSTYLTHGFLVPPMVVIFAKALGTSATAETVLVVTAFIASSTVGLLSYRLFELPMLGWTRRLAGRRIRVALPGLTPAAAPTIR